MTSNRKPLIFVIGAIVALLVLGGWYYFGSQRIISAIPDESASDRVILVTPQATPTIEIEPTEASPSATPTSEPTTKPSVSPTKATTPTKAATTVTPTSATGTTPTSAVSPTKSPTPTP